MKINGILRRYSKVHIFSFYKLLRLDGVRPEPRPASGFSGLGLGSGFSQSLLTRFWKLQVLWRISKVVCLVTVITSCVRFFYILCQIFQISDTAQRFNGSTSGQCMSREASSGHGFSQNFGLGLGLGDTPSAPSLVPGLTPPSALTQGPGMLKNPMK